MIRAAVTLVVASILIAIGTTMKLPLSTTYVTFMVFMGTSLADGAWGRESAVYRVSGVLSVIGGWFFTALSAFTAAFILAVFFYFGGMTAIIVLLAIAAFTIYRTHILHHQRLEEQISYEKELRGENLNTEKILELSKKDVKAILTNFDNILKDTIDSLEKEDLNKLKNVYKRFDGIRTRQERLDSKLKSALEDVGDADIEAAHYYLLVTDYIKEMSESVEDIITKSRKHVDNFHKPLLPVQIDEIKKIHEYTHHYLNGVKSIYQTQDFSNASEIKDQFKNFVKKFRSSRKNQIKRIKNHEVGTRNSVLYYDLISEFRNIGIYANRLIDILDELIVNPEVDEWDDEE